MTELALNPADFVPAVKTRKEQALSRPSLSYWQDAWIRLKKNRQALASLIIIILMAMFTLLGPFFWSTDPAAQDLNRVSESPSFGQEAVVLAGLPTYEESVLAGVPDKPEAAGADLPAPGSVDFIGIPSTQAVRLKWAHVPGAAGYVIYRTTKAPSDISHLGMPIGEVDGGNRVSYEDKFNLEAQTYYYSIVPKNVDESKNFISRRVDLPRTLSLEEAQKIDPQAQVGQRMTLATHPVGTDYMGRDLLARLMAGARVSLFIGFFAPLFAIVIGMLIGGIAGYFGGRVDQVLMRMADFILALPFLLFMILFKIAFGIGPGESGIMPMLIAMVLLDWSTPARMIRGQVLQLRESEFVQASRLMGAKPFYLILRHLIPNTLGVILVSLTFEIPRAIFTEAFLSFIGMGVVPPTPSWGSMCNDGIQTFLTHPHEFFFPALMISVTVLAFNLLGDGLRDALDPKMRSVQ